MERYRSEIYWAKSPNRDLVVLHVARCISHEKKPGTRTPELGD